MIMTFVGKEPRTNPGSLVAPGLIPIRFDVAATAPIPNCLVNRTAAALREDAMASFRLVSPAYPTAPFDGHPSANGRSITRDSGVIPCSQAAIRMGSLAVDPA